LFSIATAARIKTEVHRKLSDPQDTVASVTVCEDDAIWDKIMASPDVGSIRAIPWKDISESIINYLENEGVIISSLEEEIQKLDDEIKKKKAASVSQMLNDDQIQKLITESLSAEGSYGSVETAKVTACGKPGKKPKVPFDSMEVASESIVPLARPLLSTGEFKSSKGIFIDVCKAFLEAGDDELANYCGEVCSELAEVVQGVSDQHSNNVKSTALLEKTRAKKNLALMEAKKSQGQCQQSKENIEGFQKYLESLDAEIAQRHKVVRNAEAELDSAQWALHTLQEKLEMQQQLVSDAKELLKGSKGVAQEAAEALETVTKDENQFIEQVGRAKDLVSQLREELSNMKKASEAILDIKKYVSATMLKMGYYVDVAVREPVREIGLVEETNVWDYFSEGVATEQCSTDFKTQLTDFHEYCTGPAMAAFEKVKKYVDLTPICKLEEESKIAAEEDTAVQTRISLLTKDLEQVQSWLDPFKGTKMTTEKERTKIELGEPEGLRQVMGVYGNINFYTGYLKEWKVEKGKFHELLKLLTNKTGTLQADLKKGEDMMKQLKDALTEVSQAREQAKQKLDVALADEQAALEGKEEMEKAMASLNTQVEETKNMLIDLEEALKQALRLYKDARTKLVTEHAAGKDGIFALGQMHEKMLND